MSTWLLGFLILIVLGALVYGAFRISRRTRKTTNEMLLSHTFTHILEGDHSGVLERMRKLYAQTGQDVGIGLALGNLLRVLGKNQTAIRTHQSLTSRPELSADLISLIHTELAADYLASGLLERARDSLEQALVIGHPDELLARYGEQIYEKLGDYDAAHKLVTAYGKAAKEDMSSRLALLRCRQAELAWERDDVDMANTALKKAFSAQSDCIPAYLLNTRFLRESGSPEKARGYLSKHMKHFTGRVWLALEELKQIAIRDGKHQTFLNAAEKHLMAEPSDWRARAVQGTFLMDIGEHETAAEELLTCLQAAPQVLMLHQSIWSLFLRTENTTILARYRDQVKQDLVFSQPYACKACQFRSEQIQWRCPSCHRAYSFIERKI